MVDAAALIPGAIAKEGIVAHHQRLGVVVKAAAVAGRRVADYQCVDQRQRLGVVETTAALSGVAQHRAAPEIECARVEKTTAPGARRVGDKPGRADGDRLTSGAVVETTAIVRRVGHHLDGAQRQPPRLVGETTAPGRPVPRHRERVQRQLAAVEIDAAAALGARVAALQRQARDGDRDGLRGRLRDDEHAAQAQRVQIGRLGVIGVRLLEGRRVAAQQREVLGDEDGLREHLANLAAHHAGLRAPADTADLHDLTGISLVDGFLHTAKDVTDSNIGGVRIGIGIRDDHAGQTARHLVGAHVVALVAGPDIALKVRGQLGTGIARVHAGRLEGEVQVDVHRIDEHRIDGEVVRPRREVTLRHAGCAVAPDVVVVRLEQAAAVAIEAAAGQRRVGDDQRVGNDQLAALLVEERAAIGRCVVGVERSVQEAERPGVIDTAARLGHPADDEGVLQRQIAGVIDPAALRARRGVLDGQPIHSDGAPGVVERAAAARRHGVRDHHICYFCGARFDVDGAAPRALGIDQPEMAQFCRGTVFN